MSEIILSIVSGVATITLNAASRRNALNLSMAQELYDVCEEVDSTASVGAVVIQGEGSYFCAGGERQTLAAAGARPADPDMFEAMGTIYQSFKRVGELKPPTVAAIRGGAVGAGMNLALATDVRIVAKDAKLVSGFLAIHLHQGGGHGALLGRTGSREAANALALFGEAISGEQAVRVGLAWEALDDDKVEARARELASVPAKDPALARRTTQSMRLQLDNPIPWSAALEMERASQMWSMRRRHLGEPSD